MERIRSFIQSKWPRKFYDRCSGAKEAYIAQSSLLCIAHDAHHGQICEWISSQRTRNHCEKICLRAFFISGSDHFILLMACVVWTLLMVHTETKPVSTFFVFDNEEQKQNFSLMTICPSVNNWFLFVIEVGLFQYAFYMMLPNGMHVLMSITLGHSGTFWSTFNRISDFARKNISSRLQWIEIYTDSILILLSKGVYEDIFDEFSMFSNHAFQQNKVH